MPRIILLLCSALLFIGCAKAPSAGPTVLETTATGTTWELPADQVREIPVDAGKDAEDLIGMVVVPPSDTPTTVRVYERQKTVKKKIAEAVKGTSGSPDYTATSDNRDVKFTTTKERGLWPWLAGIAAIIAGWFAAKSWLARFGWIGKALSFLKWW